MKHFFLPLSCVVLSLWLGASLAVDIVAVPAVFRNIPDVIQAGRVGMVVFSRFNPMEVFWSLSAILLTSLGLRGRNELPTWSRWIQALTLLGCLFISVMFCFFWTPAIIEYARQMFELASTDPAHAHALAQHRFYHKAYVRVEGLKLFLLLGTIALQVWVMARLQPHTQRTVR